MVRPETTAAQRETPRELERKTPTSDAVLRGGDTSARGGNRESVWDLVLPSLGASHSKDCKTQAGPEVYSWAVRRPGKS